MKDNQDVKAVVGGEVGAVDGGSMSDASEVGRNVSGSGSGGCGVDAAGVGSESGAGLDAAGAGLSAGAGVGVAGVGAGSGSGVGGGSGSGVEAGSGSGAGGGSETGSEVGSESGAGAGAGARIAASKEEVAAYVRKSWRTVYRWVRLGLPVLPDGRFDLDQVDAWVRGKKGLGLQSGSPGESVPGDGGAVGGKGRQAGASSAGVALEGKDYWDMRSKQEQALKREMERRKLQNELIEIRSIEDLFVARILEVKTLLLSLERQLPPVLIHCRTDREMSEVIRKYVRRALTQFARPLPAEMRLSE